MAGASAVCTQTVCGPPARRRRARPRARSRRSTTVIPRVNRPFVSTEIGTDLRPNSSGWVSASSAHGSCSGAARSPKCVAA